MKWPLYSRSAICSFWIPPSQSSIPADKTQGVKPWLERPDNCWTQQDYWKHYNRCLSRQLPVSWRQTSTTLAVPTLTARSREKTRRQIISMLSVKPQGGSQGWMRWRGSEEMDREDGRSTNASSNTTAIVRPKLLVQGETGEWMYKWMQGYQRKNGWEQGPPLPC